MQGSELSRRFFEERVRPLIREYDAALEADMAAGVLGMGSDTSGLDDELSREHHWGPRCSLLLSDPLESRCAGLEAFLTEKAGTEFLGYPIYHNRHNRCGVSVETVSGFFRDMVGRERAPERLEEWFALTEADLYHVTHGQVFVDGPGELARRRKAFSYYPEPIWRKKLADWLIFLVGHGVYNINRARQRQDWPTATIYLGVTVKRVLETGHLLNRTYAPYNKWLYRSFQRLPRFCGDVVPLIDHAIATPSWEEKCLELIRVKVAINDELHRQGLTRRYYPQTGSPEVTEAWLYFLYDAAVELYHSIPEPLIWGRFNDVEKWETVVKRVLLDPDWKAGFPDLEKGNE
jgi:uncharacterized protein DUF4037